MKAVSGPISWCFAFWGALNRQQGDVIALRGVVGVSDQDVPGLQLNLLDVIIGQGDSDKGIGRVEGAGLSWRGDTLQSLLVVLNVDVT